MNVRRTGLAVGMAAALTLTGAGAVSAKTADPCARTSTTCSPADVVEPDDVVKEPDGKKPGCSPEKLGKSDKSDKFGKEVHGITQAALAKALAAELDVDYERALRAVKELDALGGNGRVEPNSSGFRAIAKHLGVSPKRLLQALENVKRSFAESENG